MEEDTRAAMPLLGQADSQAGKRKKGKMFEEGRDLLPPCIQKERK